jgi:hypothetical protein
MGWRRVVIRVGILWLLSIVGAAAGLELAHRIVLSGERSTREPSGFGERRYSRSILKVRTPLTSSNPRASS